MTRSRSERISLDAAGDVLRVTVGAGTRHNPLRRGDWSELARIFEVVAADSPRCVLLTGAGTSFSAGSDMQEWAGAGLAEADAAFDQMERAFRAVETFPVPVVAAVRGVATGAGCQLALACDIRVVSSTARIGMPVARLGVLISPAFAGRITRLAGAGVTRDLLYTGRLISGAEAHRIGLAERCVEDAAVHEAAEEIAGRIAALPARAIEVAKAVTSGRTPPGEHSVDYPEFVAGVGRFLAGSAAAPPAASGAA